MDHKTWRWRRKSSEKIIIANRRASLDLGTNMVEDLDKEMGSPRCLSNLSERFSSFNCDCTAKEEVIRIHARIAEQAIAGKEIAEAEAAHLKQELDKALQQGEAAEQRLGQLDAALKDCMQEIKSLRGEQDGRIHNAFSKATEDFEKAQKKLEGKLAESNTRISRLAAENTNLMKALLCKEKLIEDLDKGKGQLEAEFDMLMARLDSVEKENTYLKYECCVMEEELKLRNEEREYNRRSAMESAKHVNKLEAECQQLCNLVRKRLQGPAASLNTKNEADLRGRDQASMRRKRLSPTKGNTPDKPSKGTSFLIERVYDVEEENKTLREILSVSDRDLQSWKIKCGQMASRLAEVEAQLRELSEDETSMQLAVTGFEVKNDERLGDSESWATALLAELEQFRRGNIKNEPECLALEMGMNDHVETEKLAIVTTGTDAQVAGQQLQSTSKELLLQTNTSCTTNNKPGKRDCWLDEILEVILEEHRVSKRSFGELLQDIKIVVGCKDELSKQKEESISGLLPWKSSNATEMVDLTQSTPSNEISVEEKSQNINDASFARERIRKHFGFDRSKDKDQPDGASPNSHNTLAQMIKIQSALQEENRVTKEKLQLVTEDNATLRKQLEESNQTIDSLRRELDALTETKGVIEDQVENQRLINEDLDTQLTVAKAKLNEIHHKLSSLEVELEDKNNSCEELETTCLELQLQLETCSHSRKESPEPSTDQMAKRLRTETTENFGEQLKGLDSPETMPLDKYLCPTTTITDTTAPSSGKKSLATQGSSLRDCMLAEDEEQTDCLMSPKTKEEVTDVDSKETSFDHNDSEALPPQLKVKSPEQVGAMAILPNKKPSGGFGFIRKLFLRRKRSCSKMKAVPPLPLQRNTSALIGPRDILLV